LGGRGRRIESSRPDLASKKKEKEKFGILT
jgi:hypothetical protein